MAVKYSDIAAVQNDPTPSGKLSPVQCGGRVRIANGKYVPTAADAAGTVINLAKLPKGARLLPSSKLHFEAGQDATMTVKVGDGVTADRYLAAVAPGASAVTKNLDAAAAAPYALASDDWIIVTTGVAALTIGKYIAFELYYVID